MPLKGPGLCENAVDVADVAAGHQAGFVSEFASGTLLRKPPRIPLSAVRAAMKIRHFACSKALRLLSLPQSPIEGAFQKAVSRFRDNGYVRQS
jgi:hypothetical protein